MITTIVSFILILAVLVLVHEWGHFYAALKFGCKVDEFGFGFPPRLWSRKSKKHPGMIYSINLIPLGGFVKIKGENGDGKLDTDSFANKTFWQRAIILSAGVAMNVVLCFVLLSIGFWMGIPQVLDDIPTSATVRDAKVQIMEILPDSPAQKAGIVVGDIVQGYIDGECPAGVVCDMTPIFVEFTNVSEVQDYIASHQDYDLTLQIKRADSNEIKKIHVTPTFNSEINKAVIGVSLVKTGVVSYPVWIAPVKGFTATAGLTQQIFVSFYGLFKDLIVKQEVSVDVSGPVGIAVLTGQVVSEGIVYIMYFVALLSLNLAIINFIPFPALDGGRFLFLIIEKVRRKPVSQNIEGMVHMIGFALLLLLVIVVTIRDISNLF